MADVLSSIIFFLLLSAYIWLLLKKEKWSIFSYTLIWLLLYYTLIPVINNVGQLLKLDMVTYGGLVDGSIIYQVIVLIFILSYIVGYKATPTNIAIPISRYIKINNTNSVLKILTYLLSIISFISLIIYTIGFGGFSDAVFYANSVRTGYFRLTYWGDIGFLFFKRFAFLALLPFLVYFSEASFRRTLDKLMLFVLPVITLSVLYLLLNRGRQRIIDLILITIFAGLLKKRILFNYSLLLGIILGVLLLDLLNIIFYTKSIEGMFDLLSGAHGTMNIVDYYGEFAHPMLSLNRALAENYNFYYFTDYVYGVFGSFLPFPSQLVGKEIVYLNSQFIINKFDSTVPPGIIASGYYNFGILGVILTAVFIGFFVKKLDFFFINFIKIKSGYTYFYAYVIVFSSTIIRSGVPRYYFYDIVFVSFFLLLFFSFQFKNIVNFK